MGDENGPEKLHDELWRAYEFAKLVHTRGKDLNEIQHQRISKNVYASVVIELAQIFKEQGH